MRRWLLGGAATRCSCRVGVRWLACVPRECCIARRAKDGNYFFLPALNSQGRFQSSSDKKFHCSVCKKAFRLEMAAKLHLQQAHGGDGSVEAGPGPGAEAVPAVAPSTPPSSPVERTFADDGERRPRRMRPSPKPLHQPDREVPDAAMAELLEVWDKIGLKRLEGGFVHSTMVMKVFAARPDVSEQPLYEPVAPQGDNPFENMDQAVASMVSSESYVVDSAFAEVDLRTPFAPAPDRTLNPFCAGKVENPFTKVSTLHREVAKPVQQQQQQQHALKEEPLTAPVTPYGQLPLFGKSHKPTEPTAANPLQQGVTDSAEVASPFTAGVTNSPFMGQVASPFTSMSESAASPFEASPFTAASPFVVTPGGQTSSPFVATDAPSPFAQGASATYPTAFPGVMGIPNFASTVQPEASAPVEHECPTCGKKFSSLDGAAMHSKAKHGVIIERNKKTKDGKQKGRTVPDLPAYIPSPVDLSSTSPFGTKTAVGASWVETELIPHAQCVSNITLVGRVLDITQAMETVSHLTVFVQGEESGEEETVTVHCSGDINTQVRDTVKRNATIFVTGTLRLHPVYEPTNNKYYVSPVVHVALPTGTLAVIT